VVGSGIDRLFFCSVVSSFVSSFVVSYLAYFVIGTKCQAWCHIIIIVVIVLIVITNICC